MFIERARSERSLLAPAERNGHPTRVPLPETLRSAGALVVLMISFYNHLAPLEPEPYLVAAWAALCSLWWTVRRILTTE